jgi:5-methylcytosine-specific restriction endonuclease McrA
MYEQEYMKEHFLDTYSTTKEDLEIHHIIPIATGGPKSTVHQRKELNVIGNLQLIHQSCHFEITYK